MDRWACLNLREFPLQLLLQRYPKWTPSPVAVVENDSPNGKVTYANEIAQKQGVIPGLRYASALALEPQLRAAPMPREVIEAAIRHIITALQEFTPDVEPHSQESGILWLNASGLQKLFRSMEEWARRIGRGLTRAGYKSVVVAGYTRFGTYALAKSGSAGVHVLSDPVQEGSAARKVLLRDLGLSPRLLGNLEKLGLESLKDFLKIPSAGFLERFGPEAHHLHQLASRAEWNPIRPQMHMEPVQSNVILDYPESDTNRLIFIVKNELAPMLSSLAARCRSLTAITLTLKLDSKETKQETLRPASPTLNERQIVDLIRLRFEAMTLTSGVIEVGLIADDVEATSEQLRLFNQIATHNLIDANDALARIRAAYNEKTVVATALHEGHLPEAQFKVTSLPYLGHAHCRYVKMTPLVRRFNVCPEPFIDPQRLGDRDTFIRGMELGTLQRMVGPDAISGGWWNREVQRDYFYTETSLGTFWLYYDRIRRRWRLHGKVE